MCFELKKMGFEHKTKVASKCRHSIHPLSSAHTPRCPSCVTLAAQADLDNMRRKLEAEGGSNPATHKRNRSWNVARLRYNIIKRRREQIGKRNQLRRKREEAWEEAHQRHTAQSERIQPEESLLSACVVCAKLQEQGPSTKVHVQTVPTIAWWERQDALVTGNKSIRTTTPVVRRREPLLRPKVSYASYLRVLAQRYRTEKAISDVHRQALEERSRTERAIRRKYDLPDDFDFDPEFFTTPIRASHARHHHKQIQDSQHASERRANRYRRRAEDYNRSRSSLALSELAEDVEVDEEKRTKLKKAAEAAELQRLADVVATKVGYLYLVGDNDGIEDWRYDVERSDRDLIYRRLEEYVELESFDSTAVEPSEIGEEDIAEL